MPRKPAAVKPRNVPAADHVNRIWIELDNPYDKRYGDMTPDEFDAFMKAQCDRANLLLKKLGTLKRFMPGEHRGHKVYMLELEPNGTFQYCTDRGYWFNLDFLSE